MPWEPSRSVGPPRHGVGWVVAVVLVVALVPLLALVSVVALVSTTFGHIQVGERHRRYLKPVPIAASACPYVSLMHGAANHLQSAEPVFGMAFDEHGKALTWPQTRARLDPALRLMEWTIVVSEAKFPVPVRQQLSVVLGAVRQGRAQLSIARDGSDFTARTTTLLSNGQLAFGYAGDLIGTRCAVSLRADSSSMPYPFTIATTSPPQVTTSDS